MKRKGKESKLNIFLTATLVTFVSLLCFSIGVLTGKGWSDREKDRDFLESDSHRKAAEADNEPLGDEMTQKEVEMLTKRALEQAKAEAPDMDPRKTEEKMRAVAMEKAKEEERKKQSINPDDIGLDTKVAEADKPKKEDKEDVPNGREASTAKVDKMANKPMERNIASPMPKPTTPKPTSIEYTVQVASYKTEGEALMHSQKLIDKGFPAFPVKAYIKGTPWYRVSIGTYKTKKQAMKYERQLKKQAVVKNTFVRKIERLDKTK